jgi:acyl-CoA dehydrogenase
MALDPETRQQLVDTVARFVREKLVPNEAKVAEDDEIPEELVQGMRDLGLFGLSIPAEYGGLGLTMEEEVLVTREIGRTSPVFRSCFGTNAGIGSQAIVAYGTEAQKQEWLPKLASGEMIASFALTEPEAGSDAASLRTTARREGDYYVINGTKRFITNAPRAHVFTVMARTDPNNKGAGGISSILVPAGTRGITIGRPYKKMGQAGSSVSDVIFEDCKVPAKNLLGEENTGFRKALRVLQRGRIHLSALSTGIAERLIDECVRYANERVQFGKTIGEFQLIQGMIADSKTEAYAGFCMTIDTAQRFDRNEPCITETSCTKYFCTEMVNRVADRAVQIFGGAGYVADAGIERFYRDVRILRIYEGTSQIQQIIIAGNLLAAER